MRVGAVVLGRLGSSRLPGKVLREVAGRPLLGWVIGRLERVPGLDAVVVATSDDPADDAIERWCEAHGLECFRGDLDDVAGRVLACADAYALDAVARVNADSPWLDPALLGRAVALAREGGRDVVTNVLERSWPYGISAEVVTTEALRRARALSDDPQEAEHVTRLLYARSDAFSILNLRSDLDHADAAATAGFTVDTEDDLRRFERLVAALGEHAMTADTPELVAAARRLERPREDSR